jgi:hypothetical protein
LKWWEEYIYGPHGQMEQLPAPDLLQNFFSGDEIDYLISLVKKPLPATMSFYTFFTQIGRIFAELFPTIEKERPEIMVKMLEIRTRLDEISGEQRKLGFPNR